MTKFLLWILVAMGISSPVMAEPVVTKRLFHMVSPRIVPGPDLPKRDTPWTQEELFRLLEKTTEGKIIAIATFTLAGEKGEFTTTAMATTRIHGESRGWNVIVKGRPTSDNFTSVFLSDTNGRKANLAFHDALYMVVTEITNGTIEEQSSPKDLKRLFDGTMQYLQSLL